MKVTSWELLAMLVLLFIHTNFVINEQGELTAN